MKDVAIIAAAGWKGAGSSYHPGCSEPLLPLGDGTTVLSRLVGQLRERGFEPFIGIGKPGCRYPFWAHRMAERGYVPEDEARQGVDSSPWTEERVEYVRSLGTPIFCPNPDETSHHETYRIILNEIGTDWDRAFFSHGDMLIRDSLLDDYLALPWPCHIVYRLHTWLILDPAAASVYCDVARGHRERRMWDARDTEPAARLHEVISLVDGDEAFPGRADEWMDIGRVCDYRRALEWVKE